MGYVAVKGGQTAIENADALVEFYRLRERTRPIEIDQVRTQMRLLVDKVMGEGSLYAPDHAALALKQVEGDAYEAAFILRAYRATLERRYLSEILDLSQMLITRRISSAFREIPGGQILGPTRDYSQRLLNTSLATETEESIDAFLAELRSQIPRDRLAPVRSFRSVIDLLRDEGLLRCDVWGDEDRRVADITREPLRFPAPRSAALQALARGETAGMTCLAYSTMRGFGSGHSTIGELRVGDASVYVNDARGRRRAIGRIKLTQVQTVGRMRMPKKDAIPYITVGFGLCFGHNETKGISMATLDSAMRMRDENGPANNQEFVLYHTECVESYGFTNHWKLPHYVTFQSSLENLRKLMHRRQREMETFDAAYSFAQEERES